MENKEILEFWSDEINNNAPLLIDDATLLNELKNINTKYTKLKYPYKPFLIISIIRATKNQKFFNEWIDISNINIVKNFYDFIASDYYLFEILRTHKSKNIWELGLNKNNSNSKNSHVYKSVLHIIKDSPVKALTKKNKWVSKNKNYIKFNINSINEKNDIKHLIELCYSTIKKCIPWYENLDNTSIENIPNFLEMELQIHGVSVHEIQNRKYQHVFRKEVLDRDLKCIICCTSNNKILEACHIKPYKYCEGIESFDFNNGITLCSNHHKLFDRGLFTFDDKWKVILSSLLDKPDIDLLFKVFEPCFFDLSNRMVHKNEYMEFHNKNIYRDK